MIATAMAVCLCAATAVPPQTGAATPDEVAPPTERGAWIELPAGVSIPSGVSTTALPLPLMPDPQLWLLLAGEAGMDLKDQHFVEAVTAACEDYRRRTAARNRQEFQSKYSELHALLLRDQALRDSPEARSIRSDLLSRAIRECRATAPTHAAEWTRAVEAGAMTSGQMDRIDRDSMHMAAARLQRELLYRRLQWGPVPVPQALTVDIEVSVALSGNDASSPERQAAIEAFRRDSAAGLVKCFEEYEAYYRKSATEDAPRSKVARSVQRLLSIRLAAIESLATGVGSEWQQWKTEELELLHPTAKAIYRIALDLEILSDRLERTGVEVAALAQLRGVAAASSSRATRLFEDFALAHWQDVSERVPKSRLVYSSGLRGCIGELNAALSAALVRLKSDGNLAAFEAVVAVSASLGSLDEAGAWTPARLDKAWPGGLAAGTQVEMVDPQVEDRTSAEHEPQGRMLGQPDDGEPLGEH